MTLRVAVIGAGYLGQHHARIYAELPAVQLAGVADIHFGRAREIAEKYGSLPFMDFRDILPGVDLVSIVSPTTAHHEIALQCLRAGKDILLEKPIAVTLDEADELIAEAEARGRILQVGHLERYNRGFCALAERAGKVAIVEAERLSPFTGRAADVDVTLDLMIHDIDIVLSLVGSRVRSIRAAGTSRVTPCIDEARAVLVFENGAVAYLRASRLEGRTLRRLAVQGTDSCLELDYREMTVTSYARPADQPGSRPDPEAVPLHRVGDLLCPGRSGLVPLATYQPEYREPLKEELADFVHHVTHRTRPLVSGIEGREALSVALAINLIVHGGA